MKLTPAQKQTKLRSGIQPIQIMIFTNYLAKPQFPLTSDLFEFPQISNKPSGLEKFPLISTNVKYEMTRMRYLTHPQRVQIFFSFSRLMQFISKRPIKDESEKNEILKHNTRFMLEMLFPISYPVIKKMKTASDGYDIMSIFDAVKKEFVYQKFNTYLKLDGKMCTVDEIRFADTFGANPIYVKLYDLAKDFLVKRDAATIVLHSDMKTRLNEFKTEFDKNADIAILGRIKDEIDKLDKGSALDMSAVNDLNADIAQITTNTVDIDIKITDLTDLQQRETHLLQYKSKNASGAVGSISAIHKNIYTFNNNNSLGIITESDVTKLRDNVYVETCIKAAKEAAKEAAKSAKKAAKTSAKDTPKYTTIEAFDILIYGLTTLHEYNELKVKMPYVITTTNLSQLIKDSQSEQSDLKKELATKMKQVDTLKRNAKIDFAFIGPKTDTKSFNEIEIKNALNVPSSKSKIKSLNSSLQKMVDEYEIKSVLKTLMTTIETSINAFAAKDDTTTILSDIKKIKDTLKSVYESDANYFSQRNSLTEAFMKLRKIYGFAYLITTMHQQQDNMNIEREYNINYNIDADLKKGEYLFHKKMTDDLRAYYYPNRQSMEPAIKAIVSVKDTEEINMNAIVDMFEKHPTTFAAIDLVDLQGSPRYECQVQMVVVGGIITEENGEKIDCSYQNLIIEADVLKEYFQLIVPQFTDLTQEIAEVEKKYNIKYEKHKMEDTANTKQAMPSAHGAMPSAHGAMPSAHGAMPSAHGAMPSAHGAMPPAMPKKSSTVVSDADLHNLINTYMPSGSYLQFLQEFINNPEYENVKVFLKTAIDYLDKTRPNPNEINPTTTKTYRSDYNNKKIDADAIITSTIKKKDIALLDKTLNSTDIGTINREIGMLKAFVEIVAKVDTRAQQDWLPKNRGGKKTRKRRRQRTKRNTFKLR